MSVLARWACLLAALLALWPAVAAAADSKDAGTTATVASYAVERDAKARLVRITLVLSEPRTSLKQRFIGQGAFEVVIPNAEPAAKLPRTVNVSKEAVSELELTRPDKSTDLVVSLKLSQPVRCRAYGVDKKVVIEAAFPGEEPKPPVLPPVAAPGEQKITAEFVDTDIRVIIAALAAQSGSNLVVMPTLEGTYSLSLRGVTLNQALDALWEAWGLLTRELPGPIVLVGSTEQLGATAVDESFPVPPGWTAADAWAVLDRQFGLLHLTVPLADIPAAGPLTVHGPLREIAAARRRMRTLPAGGPAKLAAPVEVEEPLYVPLLPGERIKELASKQGVACDVLSTTADGTLVWLRGPEGKLAALRAVADKLKEQLTSRPAGPARPQWRGPQPQGQTGDGS
ncbi:MAG: hypothetical protein HYU66_03865 [Armatimonadetes bacterium]|nr:hypothetical protein [Armatimonadota bacterium]